MLTSRFFQAGRFLRRSSLAGRSTLYLPLWVWGCVVTLGLCSIQCSREAAPPVVNASGGMDGAGQDKSDLKLGAKGDGDEVNGIPLHPLCGKGSCVPDDERSCAKPIDEGMGGEGGGNIGGAAGGVSFNPGDLGKVTASCQVGLGADCDGSTCPIVRSCTPSGASEEGSPCVVAADCAPGLACVGEALSGVCRPYCCRGTEDACSDQSFCDERRLLETPEVYVPVCLPLDNCPLTDPYPCPKDRECSCPSNRACMVVRPDGATACTVPGAGQVGDSCNDQSTADCAHGFVCGPNQVCLQICSTVSEDSGCQAGWTCLKQSALGGDLGICIASTGDNEATR